MNFHENEEAVSPVIGVILMVAITVILAAVIAVFVFGMAGDVQSTKSVACTAKQTDADTIRITYMGGNDHASVIDINVKINGTDPSTDFVSSPPGVGEFAELTSATYVTTGQDPVVVTATFSDGSTQVILDTTV
jgi:flagellin-like protein